MSVHKVTLNPGLQEFITTEQQDLLQSALSAGINLPYGCASGQCGKCIARLLRGQTRRLRHSDFVFSIAQKQSGHFLTCCHSAASDLLIEIEPISSVHQLPLQHISTRVYRLQALDEQVMEVTLKTPRTRSLQFMAGQYVTIRLDNGLERNKSLANCPCDGMKPVIHVRRRADDPFSEHVFQRLKKNDTVTLHGPSGDFTLTEGSRMPVLLIAFDTGFAAIKSLLEHIIALDHEQPVTLFWLWSGQGNPYLDNYCRSLADALDYFDYHHLRSGAADLDALTDTLTDILSHTPQVPELELFMTLPHDLIAQTRHWLLEQGVQASRLHLDRMHWID